MGNTQEVRNIGDCIESFIIERNLDKIEVCSNLNIDLNFLEMHIKKSGLVAKQIYDNLVSYYDKGIRKIVITNGVWNRFRHYRKI